MKKINKKARFMAFYVLFLLIIGLSVILVTANITNGKIAARNEEIEQNALISLKEDEEELNFRKFINQDLSEGYEKIYLSNNEIIDINSRILNNSYINLMLEAKEFVDEDLTVNFDDGIFTSSEMLKTIIYNTGNKDMSIEDLNREAFKLFGNEIKFSDVNVLYENGNINIDLDVKHKDYILKFKEIHYNKVTETYDVYINSIYPDLVENIESYRSPLNLNYNQDDIIHTYKLKIQKVGEDYRFDSIYMYKEI